MKIQYTASLNEVTGFPLKTGTLGMPGVTKKLPPRIEKKLGQWQQIREACLAVPGDKFWNGSHHVPGIQSEAPCFMDICDQFFLLASFLVVDNVLEVVWQYVCGVNKHVGLENIHDKCAFWGKDTSTKFLFSPCQHTCIMTGQLWEKNVIFRQNVHFQNQGKVHWKLGKMDFCITNMEQTLYSVLTETWEPCITAYCTGAGLRVGTGGFCLWDVDIGQKQNSKLARCWVNSMWWIVTYLYLRLASIFLHLSRMSCKLYYLIYFSNNLMQCPTIVNNWLTSWSNVLL